MAKARGAARKRKTAPKRSAPGSKNPTHEELLQDSAAELRKHLAELPMAIRRQSWQIQFLVAELRDDLTEVERGVILDWLERAKRLRHELETELKDYQARYETLMRKRKRKRGRRNASRRAKRAAPKA